MENNKGKKMSDKSDTGMQTHMTQKAIACDASVGNGQIAFPAEPKQSLKKCSAQFFASQ